MNFNFMGIGKPQPTKPQPTKTKPSDLFKKKLMLSKILRVLKDTDLGQTPQQKAQFAKMEIHLMSDQQVLNIQKQITEFLNKK